MISRWRLAVFVLLTGFFTPLFTYAIFSNDPEVEQWGYQDTGVYRAWEKTVGAKRVVVAIVDNGFDHLHPDLKENVWKNSAEIPNNRIDDDNNGFVDDIVGWNFVPEDVNGDLVIDDSEKNGNNDPRPKVANLTDLQKSDNVYSHGTAVAGLIGAVGNNKYDGSGVNWKVRLMNLRVVGNSGAGDQVYVAPAIKYAVDNGADIINISLVSEADDEIKQAVEYAQKKGIVVVAAAGNDMADLNLDHVYPVCADFGNPEQAVLGVSAIDRSHRKARFSNSGSQCVDVTAPGSGINTLSYFMDAADEYVKGWFGTSFSAPFVSAAAALVKSVQPDWKAPAIFRAILSTVHKTPPQDEEEYQNLFGFGLLQVDKAVEYALSNATPDSILKTTKKFMLFSPADGLVRERNLAKENDGIYGFNTLKNANRVFLGRAKDGLVWIIEKKQRANQSVIEIYDAGWGKINSWLLPTTGVSALSVGDADGDGRTDLIVIQTIKIKNAKSKTEFKIYGLDGILLKTFPFVGTSANGFLATYSDQPDGAKNLAFLKPDKVGGTIHWYAAGELMGTRRLAELGAVADFQALDLDGDGREEFLILESVAGRTDLAVYDSAGRLNISFPLGNIKASEFKLHVYDYDDDGRNEIIVYPLKSDGLLTVWSGSGDKLSEWAIPRADSDTTSTPAFLKILSLP
ncbi:MAG: S8 family serine peptidase [Patescibacteria group bacterium]